MKYNDKEIAIFSEEKCDLEGRLNYYRPYSNIYNQTGCKERWFKLKANLLFYFRINDTGKVDNKQPYGVLVLENCKIQTEMQAATPFALSIVFEDDWERRHILSGRSEEHVAEWINALQIASYEYWRSQLLILQKRISIHTGKDPLIMVPRNDGCRRTLQWSPQPTKSTGFECHLSHEHETKSINPVANNSSNNNWANFEENQQSLIQFSPKKNGNCKQNPKEGFDNSWEFFESLNFGTDNALNGPCDAQKKRHGIMSINVVEHRENVGKCKIENSRCNPFDQQTGNSSSHPQMNLLKPFPNPPSRSRSPKMLRTQVLAHSVQRTMSDSRLNKMPMPPLRKKSQKHGHKEKNSSKFYLSDDEDSDSGVTINPIYQSTSSIIDVCDLDKKTVNKKTSEVNLIDL